jgi:tight adherence protein C
MTAPTQLLHTAGHAAAFIAAALGAHALLGAPSLPRARLGLRGLRRQESLRASWAWTLAEPLVRYIGARLERFMTRTVRLRVDNLLVRAGDLLGLQPAEFPALCLLLALLGVALGAWGAEQQGAPLVLWCLGGLALGLYWPHMKWSERAAQRSMQVERGLPAILDLLILGLSAGLDFTSALRQLLAQASDPREPLIEGLTLVLHELEIGKTLRHAIVGFRERFPGPSVAEFVAAVLQADEQGSPLGDALTIQARASRQRRSVRAEELAAKAGTRMVLPMMMAFAAAMLLLAAPIFMDLMNGIDGIRR